MREHPYQGILHQVQRPQQYTGGEWNSIPPDRRLPRVTLVYPDIYELGMSNLGLAVLRHLLLASGKFDVRRAFCPAPDLEGVISGKKLPWVDLEAGEPVAESRVVGFGIPSESLFSNVLHILRLAGLPLCRSSRGGDDPLVVMGGGGVSNPIALEPFADLVFLGEIEEQAVELFGTLCAPGSRRDRLEAAAGIPGAWVPDLGRYEVRLQKAKSLRPEWAPVRQLVPLSRVSHDRAVVEIARGCSRGCRFCQASFVGRPVRERAPEEILELSRRALELTGWEKLGLLTLSYSDYTHLEALQRSLGRLCAERKVRLTTPALRPDTFLETAVESMVGSRVTLSVEAGSSRLRRMVNKPFEESVILAAVVKALDMGATGVKLYFMIGLPEETEDDLRAVCDLVCKVSGVARAKGRKRKRDVTVALSPFVPKAHTPLQWAPQPAAGELRRRIRLIKSGCRKVSYTVNDPRLAVLEAALGVAWTESIGELLQKAVERGARFDAWGERLRWDVWEPLLRDAGVLDELREERDPGGDLPWSFVRTGVSCGFLLDERKRYQNLEITPDRRLSRHSEGGVSNGSAAGSRNLPASGGRKPDPCVLRVRYAKRGLGRFSSHLDMVRMWNRTVRRSGLPVNYSEGYVRKPRIHFGPPLFLGALSESEYIDLLLETDPGHDSLSAIGDSLPKNFEALCCAVMQAGTPSPDKQASAAVYSVVIPGRAEEAAGEAPLRDDLLEIEIVSDSELLLTVDPLSGAVRPDRLYPRDEWGTERITRIEILGKTEKDKLEPLLKLPTER
ncbi:DUF2344 domain-containing protein [Candidatus Fermentibacteria bacterium]|nr:DUF2344 domain-containing protein [Candidatus Fermentibacteria bacterium]